MNVRCIIPILLSIVIISSCQKYQKVYSYLSKDVIENFDIKPGSFWVYNNSSNSDIDSFVVESIERDFSIETHASGTFFNEYLTLNLGVYTNGNKTGEGAYSFENRLESNRLAFAYSLFNTNDTRYSTWNLYYPFTYLYINQEYLNSRLINGTSYNNLLRDSVQINGQMTKLVFGKTDGALVIESNGKPVKALLRKNLVK